MTNLVLADTVNTTEALLQSVGVPRKVIIDHQIGVLQVDTLSRRIGGNQYLYAWVVSKLFLNLAALITVRTTMNGNNGVWRTEHVTNANHQVI
ncbi:hypothetical protein D9M71_791450 [compost metagenome]